MPDLIRSESVCDGKNPKSVWVFHYDEDKRALSLRLFSVHFKPSVEPSETLTLHTVRFHTQNREMSLVEHEHNFHKSLNQPSLQLCNVCVCGGGGCDNTQRLKEEKLIKLTALLAKICPTLLKGNFIVCFCCGNK